MRSFIVSKYFTKISKIVAPLSEYMNITVGINSQCFNCVGRCTSVEVVVHYHHDNKCDNIFNVSFTSWSEKDIRNNLKSLKEFVENFNIENYI